MTDWQNTYLLNYDGETGLVRFGPCDDGTDFRTVALSEVESRLVALRDERDAALRRAEGRRVER